jgi:DNA-binding HxlR family transcriptional regulator
METKAFPRANDKPLLIQARVDLCPIKESARVLGKKWYLVIVHRLLDKPRGFNELKDAVGDISAKILSQALQDMGEKGIVERRVSSESPVRVEYSLTEQGKDLAGVLRELYDWGKRWALCKDKTTGDIQYRTPLGDSALG